MFALRICFMHFARDPQRRRLHDTMTLPPMTLSNQTRISAHTLRVHATKTLTRHTARHAAGECRPRGPCMDWRCDKTSTHTADDDDDHDTTTTTTTTEETNGDHTLNRFCMWRNIIAQHIIYHTFTSRGCAVNYSERRRTARRRWCDPAAVVTTTTKTTTTSDGDRHNLVGSSGPPD